MYKVIVFVLCMVFLCGSFIVFVENGGEGNLRDDVFFKFVLEEWCGG